MKIQTLLPAVIAIQRTANFAVNYAVNALPSPHRMHDILAQIQLEKEGKERISPSPFLKEAGGSELEDSVTASTASTADVQELYLDQRLDHFSDSADGADSATSAESATFRQRYFYTDRYVHPNNELDESNENRPTVAFLCVGGEGPSLDATVLTTSIHCTGDMIGLAEKLHGEFGWDVHLFALEHRYYGKSVPGLDGRDGGPMVDGVDGVLASPGNLRGEASLTTENETDEQDGEDEEDGEDEDEIEVDLTYLSSRQAVKDIAAFVTSPEAASHLTDNTDTTDIPWITFGGSYPGMLSAWSRLLHPDLIFGSVSNSAPVQAQLDFPEYNNRVGLDLKDEIVGGSEECRRIVSEGHMEVVAALESTEVDENGKTGRERVATLFNVCGGAESLEEERNRQVFVGWGLVNLNVQGNDPSCDGEICNIQGLCDTIIQERTANPDLKSMEILAKIKQMQSPGCDSVNYQDYLNYLSTPNRNNLNDRSWMYQTCTEFGFYQTCKVGSDCPYGQGYHEVDMDLELCEVVFGLEEGEVREAVESTLRYYGGRELTPQVDGNDGAVGADGTGSTGGTDDTVALRDLIDGKGSLQGQKKIIFLNGDVDPWSELAVTGKWGNSDHPTINVAGASHHFWTHEIKDTDGQSIVGARVSIYEEVCGWLGVKTNAVFLPGDENSAVAVE